MPLDSDAIIETSDSRLRDTNRNLRSCLQRLSRNLDLNEDSDIEHDLKVFPGTQTAPG